MGDPIGGGGLTAANTGHERTAPSRVPVQIFDLEGALLAEVAATTTTGVAASGDKDAAGLLQQGPEPHGFGPTSVPSLARLAMGRVGDARHGQPRGEATDGATDGADGIDGTPSGSALSTLDAVALFGDVVPGQVSRS